MKNKYIDDSKYNTNRSDKYQYLLLEVCYSQDHLESFTNGDSISSKLNPFQYSEQLLDLEDELKKELYKLINTHLTPRQKQVVQLTVDGYTQMEMAKMLGVNQSSITKSLNGNVDYKNGKKVYGGLHKKLKKIIANDKKMQTLLVKIRECQEERY